MMPQANEEDQQDRPTVDGDLAKKVARRRQEKARKEELEAQGAEALEQLSDEELMSRAEKKRKVAQLLTRGFVNDRLDPRKVLGDAYDPSLVYEWMRDTEQDIDRARAIGFRLEKTPDGETPEGTHGTGDGKVRLADVVLMSIDRETYEIIQEVRDEQKRRKQDAGKKEYVKRVRQAGSQAAPIVNPQGIEA